MTRSLQANRLNMRTFAQDAYPLKVATPLQSFERLAGEAQGLQPESTVQWEALGELRPRAGVEDDVWLHLQAKAHVPLNCQRCMAVVMTSLDVDQWYRFVADEEAAMAEDDESEEDLLVMEPQFDLMAVLEDELLMALPLVPMHEECPVAPLLQAGEAEVGEVSAQKPNPFAALSQLKTKK